MFEINPLLKTSLSTFTLLIFKKSFIRTNGFPLGSKNETNFQFSANEIGRQNYEIRVSSVKDEVNIKNNRQNFSLLVLKDQYKVALITGSPNKNTSKIKTIIKEKA